MSCRDLQPERLLRTGEPATVIVNVAKQVDADLIVIGQPHPSWWKWLIEQRVAETLTRTAPCPLLIATAPNLTTSESYAKSSKSLYGQHGPIREHVSIAADDRAWTY